MPISKVCDFCGHPTDAPVCPTCQSDSSDRLQDLPEFGHRPAERVFYEKMWYTNWMERVEQYKALLFRELDSETRTFVDLGCGPNRFVQEVKKGFPQMTAVGYDQYNAGPDIVTIDFENEDLPFGDKEVDVILLSHVLEHLENIHFVLENAIRSAKKVIVALPTHSILSMVRSAHRSGLGGLYGLPLVPPRDRHRWIYMLHEMDRFIGYYAYRFNLKYKAYYYLHPKSPPFLARAFKNVFVHEAVYVMEREDAPESAARG